MGFAPFSTDLLTNLLAGVSSFCWMALYVIACWRGVKERTFFIPMAAVALNLTWEFLFGFIWNPGRAPHLIAQMWVNRLWCLMDVVILATCFLYGPRSVPKLRWRIMTALSLGAALATLGSFYVYTSTSQTRLIEFQAVSAFCMNVVMSILFLYSFLSGWLGRSVTLAVAKWIGTAAITVVYFLPTSSPNTDYYPVIWATGIACFFLDGMFAYLTVKHGRPATD